MNSLQQFVKNHQYRYTTRYHGPPDSCDFKEAGRVVHNFRTASGAYFKKETTVAAVLRTAQEARVHLVRCLLHRVATRAKHGFDIDIGHEGMLRVLMAYLSEVNATMAKVAHLAQTPDKPMWTALQARLARVVYPKPFLTPPRRIAKKNYEPQNVKDYMTFYSSAKPQANMIAQTINPRRPPPRRQGPSTPPPRPESRRRY